MLYVRKGSIELSKSVELLGYTSLLLDSSDVKATLTDGVE